MNIENEIWKSLDFLGYPNYEISNWGRVKSLNFGRSGKERLLKPIKNNRGYLNVVLCENKKHKSYDIHRLVCSAFLENPDNLPCVNHKDENKENNQVNNLEWCSHKYNVNYGTCIERMKKTLKGKMSGENNPMYGKHHSEEAKQKITKAKKGKKHSEKTKQKIGNASKKPIQQYTKDMTFIKEWDSAKSASEELKIDATSIGKCCKGKLKSSGSFIWKYKENNTNLVIS